MKKIGVITFHSAENSGAVLQCIALQKAIKKLGGDPYVIDYQPEYVRNQYKIIINPFFEASKKRASGINYFKSLLAYTLQDIRFMRKLSRKIKFKNFRSKYIKMSGLYKSIEALRMNPPEADVYIAGSDQIWNRQLTGGSFDPAFFLDFGDERVEKYTYAVSTGEVSDDEVERINNASTYFNMVSFRESSIFDEFFSKYKMNKYLQSVDPTLLMDSNDWGDFVDKSKPLKKYILVYALEKNDAFNNIIQLLNGGTEYEIIDISQCNIKLQYSKIKRMDFAPNDFLSYIYNAEIILTNSFHCTVFSIIFHKKFIVVPHKKSNTRISDLLLKLKLEEHFYNGTIDSLYKNIDWKKVDDRIKKYRADSITYLKKIIE